MEHLQRLLRHLHHDRLLQQHLVHHQRPTGWTKQLRSVLRAPARLHIRGEYVPGPDEAGLDAFVLSGRP